MPGRADIWMPLFVGDYLADTAHLNTMQHGGYLLLLMHHWRCGPLPDDDAQLAAIARLEVRIWKTKVAPVVRRFFIPGPDGLVQRRLMLERDRAEGLSGKRSKAGSEGARRRWHTGRSDRSAMANAIAEPLAKPCQTASQNDAPSQSPSHPSELRSSEGARAPRSKDAGPDLPSWVPRDAWNDFIEMRRKARKPPTPRAVKVLIRKLDGFRQSGYDLEAVIEASVVGGWTDLYPPRTATQCSGAPRPAGPKLSDPETAWASVADEMAANRDEPNRLRPWVNGFDVRETALEIARIARLVDDASYDWSPLAEWLRSGYRPDEIVTVVKRVAGRPDYVSPASLRYFDRAVRDRPPSGHPSAGRAA